MPQAIPLIVGAATSFAVEGAVIFGFTVSSLGASLIGGAASFLTPAALRPSKPPAP